MTNTIEINRLSFEEKLELYDKLVDSLTPDRRFDPSPAWHRDVLEERERLVKEGKAEYVTLDDMIAEFRTEGLCK